MRFKVRQLATLLARSDPNLALNNRLMTYLDQHGVPSRPYFTPIHLQPFYQQQFGWKRGDLPHTEKAGDTFLALPFSGVMTEDQVDYVCDQLRSGIETAQFVGCASTVAAD